MLSEDSKCRIVMAYEKEEKVKEIARYVENTDSTILIWVPLADCHD